MKERNLWKKIKTIFILTVIIPLLFFLLIEVIIRISGINTDVVKSDTFKIDIPMWASNNINFFVAEDIYRQILDNKLPVESAEWMNYFVEAKYVRYKMKSNISVHVNNTINRMEIEKGIKVHIKTNSEGYRTREVPIKKGENVYRIVLLGDSSTFGWVVNQDERFSRFLEDQLNAVQEKIRFEVINYGIPGYTTYHGKAVFDRFALKYSPDMVILSFGANDGKPIPREVKKILKQKSWIEDLKYFLWNFKTYKLLRKIILSKVDPFDRLKKKQPDKVPTEPFISLDEFRKNLEYIIDKGKKKGAETVLLGLCCPVDYLAKMSAVGRRKGVVMIDGMHVLLQSLPSIKKEKKYRELLQYYRTLYGDDVLKNRRLLAVTNDTCHPNIIGHKVIASVLYDRVFKGKIFNKTDN